ncbi:MAG: (Fe-S)-binding protein [Mariniphaga sp.]
MINSLIADGKIKLEQNGDTKTVIHDSCYLGRYNQIIDEPREILKACTGKNPLEMDKNKVNSFCCGAGGGRMWMDELTGKRISLERTQQALKTNPTTIAVACPYCMTMFEDGLKDEKVSDKVRVRDIAELVAESMI